MLAMLGDVLDPPLGTRNVYLAQKRPDKVVGTRPNDGATGLESVLAAGELVDLPLGVMSIVGREST